MTAFVIWLVLCAAFFGYSTAATYGRRWPWQRQVGDIWASFDGSDRVEVGLRAYAVDPVVVIAMAGQRGYRFKGWYGRWNNAMTFELVGPPQAIPDTWPSPGWPGWTGPPMPLGNVGVPVGPPPDVVGPHGADKPWAGVFPRPTPVTDDPRPYPWNQIAPQ
ncbi:hypothetical protein ACU686_02270 [Yinghuangia aomiensis]